MKVVFLILVIFTKGGDLKYEKIPFYYSEEPPLCEEMFEEKVKYIKNPNYTEGNNEIWILVKYKKQNVIAHFCQNNEGTYVR